MEELAPVTVVLIIAVTSVALAVITMVGHIACAYRNAPGQRTARVLTAVAGVLITVLPPLLIWLDRLVHTAA